MFVSVKALPRSVKIQSYNDTMKDKLTDIEKRVRQAAIYIYIVNCAVIYYALIKGEKFGRFEVH